MADITGRKRFAKSLEDRIKSGTLDELSIEDYSTADELGLSEGQVTSFVDKVKGRLNDDAKAQEETAVGNVDQPSQRTLESNSAFRDRQLQGQLGIDTMEPGGFAKRDQLRQGVNYQVQQDKRVRRITNLAYRDAIRRGDLMAARAIALDSAQKGIAFGGIAPAGYSQSQTAARLSGAAGERMSFTGESPVQRSTDVEKVVPRSQFTNAFSSR